MRRIAFPLDPALGAAITAKAADSKASHGQVVLDGVEAAHTAGAGRAGDRPKHADTERGPLPMP